MTVTIFVWRPNYFSSKKFSVGHASILIDEQYVSWFPEKHQLSKAMNSPALHHRMKQDIEAENGLPGFVSGPLPGLDEGRMSEWAFMILKGGPSIKGMEPVKAYRLLTSSCAGLVFRAILVGLHRDGGILDRFIVKNIPQPLDCELAARIMTGNK